MEKVSSVLLSEVSAGTQSIPRGTREEMLILPNTSMDARWWVLHAETLLQSGSWRVRHTNLDNAPNGRDVHWSSLLVWVLAGLACVWGWAAGLSPADCVAEAALVAGPVLLACLMGPFVWMIVRRFGAMAAAYFAVIFLTCIPIYRTFQAGEADHHGIVLVFSMACVFCLFAGGMGFVRDGRAASVSPTSNFLVDEVSARRWFVISGVLGGLAIWISAATAIPVLGGIAVGAFALAAMVRRRRPVKSLRAGLWKCWATAGAGTCLGLYLLEYFPEKMGWRLEVNHPLFALAWLGGGWVIFQMFEFANGKRWADLRGTDWLLAIGALCALIAPLALMIWRAEGSFWVADRFLLDLHREYISEFKSLPEFFLQSKGMAVWFVYGFWPASCLVMVILTGRFTGWKDDLKMGLLFLSGPTVVMQILAWIQVRWAAVALSMWALCLLAVFVMMRSELRLRPQPLFTVMLPLGLCWTAVVFILAPQLIIRIGQERSCLNPPMAEEFGSGILLRDIAHRLLQASPEKVPVVLSGPNSSTDFAYFGRLRTLGTLYWENMPGLKRAAEIFTASDEKTAFAALAAAGVTHIVIPSWDNFAEAYARLSREGHRKNEPLFFEDVLQSERLPTWLRPLCYPIPASSGLDSNSVRIFAVRAGQTAFESAYYQGVYHWEAGNPRLARQFFLEAAQLRPGNEMVERYLEALKRSGLPLNNP